MVDAIEFAITGSITRLEGRGTSDINVKEHAPHVDARTDPKKAKVRLKGIHPVTQQVCHDRAARECSWGAHDHSRRSQSEGSDR